MHSARNAGSEPDSSAVLAAVNEAARHVQTVTFVFLATYAYVAVTVSSTTHSQLILESPVTLPLLQVQVPMQTFYVVAPSLLLVLHLNLFVQMVLLSKKAGDFLRLPAAESRGGRLYPLPLLHLLAGRHSPFIRSVLALIVYLTVLVAPPAVLVFTQVRFVPYHSNWITGAQAAIVLTDLFMIWMFWPKIRGLDGSTTAWLFTRRWKWRWAPWPMRVISIALTGAIAGFALAITAQPKNTQTNTSLLWWLGANAIGAREHWNLDEWSLFSVDLNVFEANLVYADPPPDLRERLPKVGEDDNEGWLDFTKGIDLRWRDLRNANLQRARLLKADLRGAALTGALLGEADLSGARLDPPTRVEPTIGKPATLAGATLAGAKLDKAVLHMANLEQARLQNSDLYRADLRAANLRDADLSGAVLHGAKLQRANLFRANLEGAVLTLADLEYTKLMYANLQGANLRAARLQGARPGMANLKGTDLTRASMQGAVMGRANLAAANLRDAYLQRAILRSANLEGANLRGANIEDAKMDWATGLSQPQLDMAQAPVMFPPSLDDHLRPPPSEDSIWKQIVIGVGPLWTTPPRLPRVAPERVHPDVLAPAMYPFEPSD